MDETLSPIPPAANIVATSSASSFGLWPVRVAICLLIGSTLVLAWSEGVRLRHWVWDTTVPIRFVTNPDIDTGIDHDYAWGLRAAAEGVCNQYEKMQAEKPGDRDWLDDPPLRLAIFSAWGKWSMTHFPKEEKGVSRVSYALASPMLHLTLFMEALGLVSAFLLTRLWVRRGIAFSESGDGSSGWVFRSWARGIFLLHIICLNPISLRAAGIWVYWNQWTILLLVLVASALIDTKWHRELFRGCIPGVIAVLLLWFNPAVMLHGFGWVTWDIWLIPMFLLAALFASLEWWFTAGVTVAIGAMFNGQQVLAIPLLAVWSIRLAPYDRNRWVLMAEVLWIAGCVALAASVDWPVDVLHSGFKHAFVSCFEICMKVGGYAIPVIWLAARLQWMSALRLAAGILIAGALIASPWLLSYIPADKLQVAHAAQMTGPASLHAASQVPIGVFKITRAVDVPAVLWVIGVLISAAGLPWFSWLTLPIPDGQDAQSTTRWRRMLASQWSWRGMALLMAIALVMWPWLLKRNYNSLFSGFVLWAALMVAVQLIRPRGIPYVTAGAVGIALLMCMTLFHGSSAWYECAFNFGYIHWPTMTVGMTSNLPGVDNLPGIMSHDFGWSRNNLAITALDFVIPKTEFWFYLGQRLCHITLIPWDPIAVKVPLGVLLKRIFYWSALVCCVGGAVHARRRSPRVLIALTALWLVFFCFPPSINERYLVFAAGISCVCIGESVGMTLLGVLLSIVSFTMSLDTMLSCCGGTNKNLFGRELARQFPHLFDRDASEKLLEIMNPTHPDVGYAVILCGFIFVYYAIAPKRKIFQEKPVIAILSGGEAAVEG